MFFCFLRSLGQDNNSLKRGASAAVLPSSMFTYFFSDERPIILFDLNGVLVDEAKRDKGGKRTGIRVRPGLEALLGLLGRFNLGIFSSATAATVGKAVKAINGYLRNNLGKSEHCK